jgi:ribosomal protein S18 acetylase RimI-like enzyme
MIAERLGTARVDEVVDVLCDAFRDYPVMQFVIGPGQDDYDDRLRRLVGFFVRRRLGGGAPLLGVSRDGGLVAAAALTVPAESPPSADLVEMRVALWRALGDDARERYDRYGRAAGQFESDAPHHHLNMIGVRRAHAGRGCARTLLDAVAQLGRDRPRPHRAGSGVLGTVSRDVRRPPSFACGLSA